LKEIAYKIIDFIAQFENELVRIWNKPKFVLGSHYVITLNRIAAQEGGMEVLERIFGHPGMEAQVEEWRELGMVEEDFSPEQVWVKDLIGKRLHERFHYLPIDTKHFPDLEMAIVGLFDHLDQELDGWLVHSENYQALNTMLPKFKERVKCIYIDPPYNTGNDEFIYNDRFRHSSWLTMMENRMQLAREWMREDGATFVSIDDNEVRHLLMLCEEIFGNEQIAALFIAQTNPRGRSLDKYVAKTHEYVAAVVKQATVPTALRQIPKTEKHLAEYKYEDELGSYRLLELRNRNPMFNRQNRPNLFYPLYVNPTTKQVSTIRNAEFFIEVLPRNSKGEDDCWTWSREKASRDSHLLIARQTKNGGWRIFRKDYLPKDTSLATTKAKSIWLDKSINHENGKELLSSFFGRAPYDFPKSVALVRKCLEIGSGTNDFILDFFAGSGTTGHAVINLNREDGGRRKYILVEMADYFHTVLLPRIKKVVFSDKWKDGKAQEGGKGISHFVKYFRLEQYEEVLRKAHYRGDDALSSDGNLYDLRGRILLRPSP